MKAIFCHDLPLYKDVNGVYCSTTLTNAMFSRYFTVASKLIVATRVYPVEQTYKEIHQEALEMDNLTVLCTPNMMTPKGILIDRRAFKNKLRKVLFDVDLVFLRGGECANVAYELCKELKKPYLVECGGSVGGSFWNHSLLGKLIAPRMEFYEKKMIQDAAYVTYVIERFLQKKYPTKGRCIHASNVYLDEMKEEVLKRRLDKIEKMSAATEFVIGTIAGVNVKYKGQQYIIRTMARLLSQGYKIRYELVGGGDPTYLRSVAKKYGVEKNVLFLGEKTHDEVLTWLDSVDIYAQPSKQEGLPRALIEAMSRACPAVGSTTAGIPELLSDNVIFSNGSVSQIERILKNIIDHEVGFSSETLAKRNFKKAKEYEHQKIKKRRDEIFKEYAQLVKNGGVL